jgi:hypothetical protein
MKSRAEKFEAFQKSVLDHLTRLNDKLDKLCALSVSNQLLQECVGPDGTPRSAEECGEVVVESYMAGMCMSEELEAHTKDFRYQKSEFFLDDDEEDDDDGDEDEEGPDNTNFNPPRLPVNAF